MTTYTGDGNNNVFNGGSDADHASGNGGDDTLTGGDNNDILAGGSGSDTLDGGAGDDTLYSGDESPPFNVPYYNNPFTPPLLDRGSEVDTVTGGDGDDRIFVGYGDNADGGGQSWLGDYLYISFQGADSGVVADFDLATQTIGGGTITGFENISWIEGSEHDDDISVGSGSPYTEFTTVWGMGGNDRLVAGYYTGTLFGGEGDDTLDGRASQYLQSIHGDAGNDVLYTNTNTFAIAYGGDGDDTIYSHAGTFGGAGNDTILLQWSYYYDRVYGEAGDDEIVASDVGHQISGGSGADLITGGAGSDILYSDEFFLDDLGLEQDTLTGGGGDDQLFIGYGDSAGGGAGTDMLTMVLSAGTAGVNVTALDAGTSFAIGGGTIQQIENIVRIDATAYADTLILGAGWGATSIRGGGGNDVLVSLAAAGVSLYGEAGDDRLGGGAGNDVLNGGDGIDTADYGYAGAGVTVSLASTLPQNTVGAGEDQLYGIENLVGSDFGDTLSGSGAANVLTGGAGDDHLSGLDGADTLNGGLGADTMLGGLENDVFIVDNGGDVVTENAGEGTDEVRTGLGAYTLGAHVENLTGTAASQTLTGNGLANLIAGGGGTDTMAGGLGDDTYVVDDASDVVTENAGEGTDEIRTGLAAYSIAATAHVENLTGTGAAAQTLTGNSHHNRIDGGLGADAMAGGAGNDTYVVDNEGDTVTEGANAGSDTVESSVTFTLGANVEHLTLTGTGAVNATGNAAFNILTGNSGANRLDGGAGGDRMSGGDGDDTYIVDNVSDRALEASATGGYDTVRSAISFSLAYQYLERLVLTGTANIDATGNSLDNWLVGNAGNNVLDGSGGLDVMNGHGGDDTYVVDRLGDTVIEAAGGGTDLVLSSSTYALSRAYEIENLTLTGHAAINAYGNQLDNILTGNANNNVLNGSTGADTMIGGGGSDTYYVDDAGDLVIEEAGRGTEMVHASISYTLTANVENGAMIGNAALNLTGNDLANRLFGNGADNVLDGGAGADYLTGRGGNDTYIVDNVGDRVLENDPNGGTADRILASVSFGLGGIYVETLELTGNAAIDATGNGLANTLIGNGAANRLYGHGGDDLLDGGAGADRMEGGAGSDTYVVDHRYDRVIEGDPNGGAADTILASVSYSLGGMHVETLELTGSAAIDATGNGLANTLTGNGAANRLYGKGGSDVLEGGGGADGFYFDTALNAATNVDAILDFTVADDTIHLSRSVFGAIAADGTLAESAFVAGTSAQDADDRIVYDAATGNVFYDADGSGAGEAILFATVTAGTALTHLDFSAYTPA